MSSRSRKNDKPSGLRPPTKVQNLLRSATATADSKKFPVHKTGLKRRTNVENIPPTTKRPLAQSNNQRLNENPEKKSLSSANSKVNVNSEQSKAHEDLVKKQKQSEEQVQELQTKLEISQGKQNLLQEKLDENKETVSELKRLKDDLRQALEDKKEEISGLKAEISSLENEKSRLTERLDSEMSELLRKHKSEVASLTESAENLDDKLRKTTSELKSAEDQIVSLKSSINSQSTTIFTQEADIRNLRSQTESLNAKLEDRDGKIIELNEAISKYEKLKVELEDQLREDETIRRRLHNEVQELKGNIRVFCRIRPPLENESKDLSHLTFDRSLDPKDIKLIQSSESADGRNVVKKRFEFSFDRVFNPDSTQSDVFKEISQLVQSACDGYNVCIFAYGVTGSGKTFTMEGSSADFSDPELMGVIPRAVTQIWAQAEKLKEKGWVYTMQGSFLEIYNESINDLLAPAKKQSQKYDIKHDPIKKTTHVLGLEYVELESPDQVIELLSRAMKNRKIAGTQCNDRSSRSHSVFTLRITGSNSITGESSDGSLNLVDLAGSERLSQSKSTGERLKETQAINKSLSSLGDVIAALSTKEAHVPYRNSKLTYLLQYSLGGNSKTLMFVNISPKLSSLQETVCSLRFATKVNNCQIGTAQRQVK